MSSRAGSSADAGSAAGAFGRRNTSRPRPGRPATAVPAAFLRAAGIAVAGALLAALLLRVKQPAGAAQAVEVNEELSVAA